MSHKSLIKKANQYLIEKPRITTWLSISLTILLMLVNIICTRRRIQYEPNAQRYAENCPIRLF